MSIRIIEMFVVKVMVLSKIVRGSDTMKTRGKEMFDR